MTEASDMTDLVVRSIKGDKAAFEQLYKKKVKTILLHAYSILSNHHDAEDAAQTVVIRMYRHIGKLHAPEAFDAWMHRIVQRTCYDILARRKTRAEDFESTDEMFEFEETQTDVLPAAYIENEELFQFLQKVIAALPERRRTAVMLYYFDGMSYKEIAEAMESTVSTVSTNIMRAKKTIKTEMEKYMDRDKSETDRYVATPLVLGAACEGMFNAAYSPESLEAVIAKCGKALENVAAVSPGNTAVRKGTGSKIAIVCLVIAIVTGLYFLGTTLYETADDSLEGSNAPKSGVIRMESEVCACGHVNPTSVSAADLDFSYASASWTITSAGSDEILYSGGGDTVTGPLTELYQNARDGDYTLTFEFFNESGNSIFQMIRSFTIDTGDVSLKGYL